MASLQNLYIPKTYTGTARQEWVRYQLPDGYSDTAGPYPLCIVWHSYSRTPLEIETDSTWPQECNSRGWIFIAPMCYDQVNFSCLDAHHHVTRAVEYLINVQGWSIDTNKIYHVGFSMGATGALNYVSRHIAIGSGYYPAAGVAIVAPVLDLKDAFNQNDLGVFTYAPWLIGGTPADHEYRYKQASPMKMTNNVYVLDHSPARNLMFGLPIWHSYAGDDTSYNRLVQNQQLKALLQAIGASYREEYTAQGGANKHSWSLMNETDAAGYLSVFSLSSQDRASVTFIADRESKFHWISIKQPALGPNEREFSKIIASASDANNKITVTLSYHISEFKIDTVQSGISGPDHTSGIMRLDFAQGNPGAQTIIFTDIPTSPSSIENGTGVPFSNWSHDAVTDELSIQRSAGQGLDLAIYFP